MPQVKKKTDPALARRNNQTLSMMLSFSGENIEKIIREIQQDPELSEQVEITPEYDPENPQSRYDLTHKAPPELKDQPIGNFERLGSRAMFVYVSQGNVVDRLRELIGRYK